MQQTLGIIWDELDSTTQCQITRDLMLLQGSWDLAVNVNDPGLYPLLSALDIPHVMDTPVLNLVYKVGEAWPDYPRSVPSVLRDLQVKKSDISIDPEPRVGYYLAQQGRPGANRTEQYLNRIAPRGCGVTDAFLFNILGSTK